MISRLPHPKDARGREIDVAAIAGLLDRIVQEWDPLAVWLFGSRARGDATPESDWDLLVVAPDTAKGIDDPLAGWRLRKELKVRSDLILCQATEFQEARNTPNTLAFEAAHGGVLVYER